MQEIRSHLFSPEQIESIVSMYRAGETSSVIAKLFGTYGSTICRILAKVGCIRTNSEAQALKAAKAGPGQEVLGKKGAVQSKKSGCWFACDSAYEFIRMHQLDDDATVLHWSRCEDRIEYEFDGRQALYVPDINVVRVDGARSVEEIKPGKMVGWPKNQAKFAAGRSFYAALGIEFLVVTEAEIGWDEIRRWDGEPLMGVPDEARAAKRRASALKHLHAMSPEERADYNLKAKIREAAKRAKDREAYNAQARQWRIAKKQREAALSESLF